MNKAKVRKLYWVTLSNLHPIREAEVRKRVNASFLALPNRRLAASLLGNTVAEWLIVKALEE